MITIRKIITAVPSFVILLLAACNNLQDAGNSQAGPLSLKPGEGRSYTYSILNIAHIDSSLKPGGDSTLLEFELVARRNNAQSIPMTMVIKRAELHTTPVRSASGKKNDVFAASMQSYFTDRDSLLYALTGDTLHLLVDHIGNVLKVTGFENIVERLRTRFPRNTVVKSVLEKLVGDLAIRDLFSGMFFYLPEQPVQASGSWVRNFVLVAKAPVKHSNMIAVTGSGKDSLLLNIRSRISAGEEVTGKIKPSDNNTVDTGVRTRLSLPASAVGPVR